MNQCTVNVAVAGPYDWDAWLAFVGARAITGVEAVHAGGYRRTIRLARAGAVLEVTRSGTDRIQARLGGAPGLPCDEAALGRSIERLCGLDVDIASVRATLGADPVLAQSLRLQPGLRVPGAWDGFELGVRAILGQQVTVKGASTLSARLVERFGRRLARSLRVEGLGWTFPTARTLARAPVEEIGLPMARADCIREFARRVASGRIRFDGSVSHAVLHERLTEVRGIGPWTAAYVRMRAARDEDAFPGGDLILRRAADPSGEGMTTRDLEQRSAKWRPWRAYAAMHLWATYARRLPQRAAGG